MIGRYLVQFLIMNLFGILLMMGTTARRGNSFNRRSNILSKRFPHAVVVSDSESCSSMGNDVLRQNGSAVDAAITTVLCLGISLMQSTGIGGGGHMTIYKQNTGKAEVIDFRECAPSGVKDEDFKKPWREGEYFVDPKLIRGGMSIGVPGMLKGFELVHKRHGKRPWRDIFETAAKLAERQNNINPFFLKHLYKDIAKYEKTEFKDFRTFLSSLDQGNYKNPALAKTLRTIGDAGSAAPFYDGVLSQTVVNDIQRNKGKITLEDLKKYRAILREPVEIQLDDKKLYSTPPPAGGTILLLILNILKGYHFSGQHTDSNSDEIANFYHKMIEAFKWSYANTGLFGDPEFPTQIHGKNSVIQHEEGSRSEMNMQFVDQNIKDLLSEEHGSLIRSGISETRTYNIAHYHPDGLVGKLQGTTHVSVLSENGDAVAITSSLNSIFGSYVFSKELGILFNNQMKDFREFGFISDSGSARTTTDVILPSKRIPSLMSPSVMVDKDNNVVMVIGAAGGSRIPSVVAQLIVRYLWLGTDLQSSINMPRFHHQLYPNLVFVEKAISHQVRTKLEALGHKISENIELIAHLPLSNLARVNALVVERNAHSKKASINGVNDQRGGGGIAGY